MKQQRAHWSSPLLPLSPATISCLDADSDEDAVILSGTDPDGVFSWLVHGCVLEVFSTSTCERLAAWSFGSMLHESGTVITAISSCHRGNGDSILLVGTTMPFGEAAQLCVFDVGTSRVTMAIRMPHKVTSLEAVLMPGRHASVVAPLVLSQSLHCFCGVVAVGTDDAHIYLLDLCLDEESPDSDELRPRDICTIDSSRGNVATIRPVARSRGQHLCLELGVDSHSADGFVYRRPDGSVLKSLSDDDVCVSALHFVQSTGMLAVGFSHGSFQLWQLSDPSLEYSSRYEDDAAPVTHFTCQEPEDDPRNFYYLWVAHGPMPAHHMEMFTSSIVLFQLEYEMKTWHNLFGHHYQELTSVGPLFEHELDTMTAIAGDELLEGSGSRIIACRSLDEQIAAAAGFTADIDGNQSFDESGAGSRGVCMFAWQAVVAGRPVASSFVALFDLNRWYHAHMPVSLRMSGSNQNVCSYFAFCCLDDVLQAGMPSRTLNVHVCSRSVTLFKSQAVPPPETHIYPSALAFHVSCVTDRGIVQAKFLGIQRQILTDVQTTGPSALTDPSQLYNLCLYAGLLARPTDSLTVPNINDKRKVLLSMALSYNLDNFLSDCISQWACCSDFVSNGCSLRLLLDWAWEKAAEIKSITDNLCECLYNWSGWSLDERSIRLLHQRHLEVTQLVSVMSALAVQSTSSTDEGQRDLEMKRGAISLLHQHLTMVVWFLSAGLLPEFSEDTEKGVSPYLYPVRALEEVYRKRRVAISKLHSELKPTHLLLIDGLVEQLGPDIGSLWWDDSRRVALYPPPSLHALLSIYLLENVDIQTKHMVTFYLLCDVYSRLDEHRQEQFAVRLSQFAQTFSLPLGLSRTIQGFWLLDHEDFEDSLLYLLDPLCGATVAYRWCDWRVVRALLYQGHARLALRYVRVAAPPVCTRDDVKLRLTVLLANGLISEAFEYQRMCRDCASAEDLLTHLFLGAQQTKTVDQLLQLPFTHAEETDLVRHLLTSREQRSRELLVLYYLQRARYVDAIALNDTLKTEKTKDSIETGGCRDAIIAGYLQVLPPVQRRLALSQKVATLHKRSIAQRKEVRRPTPLSTVINRTRSKVKVITQATLIGAVLDKVEEMSMFDEDDVEESSVHGEEEAMETTTPTMRVTPAGGSTAPPFMSTPSIPRTASCVTEPVQVHFPSPARTHHQGSVLSPAFVPASPMRRVAESYNSSPSGLRTPLAKLRENMKGVDRCRLSGVAADVAALLQTPPVCRHTPRTSLMNSTAPQSIIKVRSALKTTIAASVQESLHMPTPPRLNRPALGASLVDNVQTDTPKQLRFADPSPEESKAKTVEITKTLPSRLFAPKVTPSRSDTAVLESRHSENDDQLPEEVNSDEDEEEDDQGEHDEREDDLVAGDDQADGDHQLMRVDSDITFNFSVHHGEEKGDAPLATVSAADDEAISMDVNDEQEQSNSPSSTEVIASKVTISSEDVRDQMDTDAATVGAAELGDSGVGVASLTVKDTTDDITKQVTEHQPNGQLSMATLNDAGDSSPPVSSSPTIHVLRSRETRTDRMLVVTPRRQLRRSVAAKTHKELTVAQPSLMTPQKAQSERRITTKTVTQDLSTAIEPNQPVIADTHLDIVSTEISPDLIRRSVREPTTPSKPSSHDDTVSHLTTPDMTSAKRLGRRPLRSDVKNASFSSPRRSTRLTARLNESSLTTAIIEVQEPSVMKTPPRISHLPPTPPQSASPAPPPPQLTPPPIMTRSMTRSRSRSASPSSSQQVALSRQSQSRSRSVSPRKTPDGVKKEKQKSTSKTKSGRKGAKTRQPHFTFSNPTLVESIGTVVDTADTTTDIETLTTAQPFVFSPPLTRSHSRQVATPQVVRSVVKKAKKTVKKASLSSSEKIVEEDTMNLLSPYLSQALTSPTAGLGTKSKLRVPSYPLRLRAKRVKKPL